MSTRRLERINDLLRELIAEVIAHELKDPRLERGLISVTEVRTSSDLGHAQVLISVLGSEEEANDALAALQRSRNYIWRRIRPQLRLRSIPQLTFRLDDRIAEDRRIQDLINELPAPNPLNDPDPDTDANTVPDTADDGQS